MSDMSVPPQLKVPLSLADPVLADTPAGDRVAPPPGFAWPVPPLPGYALASPLNGPEMAELEGPNGKVTGCRLLALNPVAGTVQVHTGSARGPLTLKHSQFRRLTLLRPLKPLSASDRAARPRVQLLRITYRDQHLSEVKSVGQTELPIGHFVFSPLNTEGDLLRTFYPRPTVLRVEPVDLGQALGRKALAAEPGNSPGQINPVAVAQARHGTPAMAPGEAKHHAAARPSPPLSLADRPATGPAAPASPAGLPLLNLSDLPAEASSRSLPPVRSTRPAGAAALPTVPGLLDLSEPSAAPTSMRPLPSLALLPELTEEIAPSELTAPLGNLLHTALVATPEALLAAVEQQARMPLVRIGEALLGLGYITPAKLDAALAAQGQDRSVPLGELLARRGDVSRVDLQTALARKMGYPVVDVERFPVAADAAQRVPLALARRLPVLPLVMHGQRLVVALEDPTARALIDELEFNCQCKVVPVLARAGTLLAAIEAHYLRSGHETIEPTAELRLPNRPAEPKHSTDKLLANLELDTDQPADEGPPIEQSDNSLVRLINSIILDARSMGVSDIHIECPPSPQKVKVRFRRDGVLRQHLELPPNYRQAMVARLKIMCDLDISERRKPQDGKINFAKFMQGHRFELRVATIPTANGLEDVVMRLLASARALPLDAMNLQPDVLDRLRNAVERPYGLVLCVGPTGSGKTTTLHAALAHINTPERKIWTAEDPVEITQSGLRQVQVNPKIDWTFAKALRAFLRADPDVVMVGEIRDAETAQMAVEASLTGHLVLSTLHTNSAPETVTRLLDMGMDPFSFSDSLLAVLAQRLVRRWCQSCVTQTPATTEQVTSLLSEYLHSFPDADLRPDRAELQADWLARYGQDGVLMHHHAPGCPKCSQSGFSGRVGLHELLTVSRGLRQLVQARAPAADVQRQALQDGMRTLRQDGILKVLAGLTSIEEVRATSNQ